MSDFLSRIFQGACSIFAMVYVGLMPCIVSAEDNSLGSGKDETFVLKEAIKDYVNFRSEYWKSEARVGREIRVLYLGFTEAEISENARAFPVVPEVKFLHLPYGRTEYYETPINLVDYQKTDTIVALNLDLSRKVTDWEATPDRENDDIAGLLDPKGRLIHNLAMGVFHSTLKFPRGTAVELGAPLGDLKNEDVVYREHLFEGTCSAGIEYNAAYDDRPQRNTMSVYSSAAPGSNEQVDCLVTQAMIFVRPEAVPYRSIGDLRPE
ncbi:hypothetical protein [Roseibium sp. M-1]